MAVLRGSARHGCVPNHRALGPRARGPTHAARRRRPDHRARRRGAHVPVATVVLLRRRGPTGPTGTWRVS